MRDVVVVGGGVIGRLLALRLAAHRVGVTVLDRGDRCAGTRRSAAVVRTLCSDPVERELARLSLEDFRGWAELTGQDGGFRPTPAVVVASQELAPALLATGRSAALEARELAQLAPWHRPLDGALPLLDAEAGTACPARTLASLRRALRQAGVRVEQPVTVERLLVRRGTVVGVRSSAGDFHAGLTVIAAGPWSATLLGTAGWRPPISPTLTWLLVLGSESPPRVPVVDLAAGVLVRSYGRSRCLAGTRRSRPCRLDAPGPHAADPVLSPLAGVAPELAASRVEGGWCGIYDMTPDGRPLVGCVPGLAQSFVIAGFSGAGFKTAPAVCRLAADTIAEGSVSPLLADYSPGRFGTDNAARS